jgi:ribonuclease H2 subunit A
MVYGTAFCPVAMKDAVKDLGVAGKGEGKLWCALFRVLVISVTDSKTLNEEQREKFFEMINTAEYLGWKVEVLSPNHISNCMLQR